MWDNLSVWVPGSHFRSTFTYRLRSLRRGRAKESPVREFVRPGTSADEYVDTGEELVGVEDWVGLVTREGGVVSSESNPQ